VLLLAVFHFLEFGINHIAGIFFAGFGFGLDPARLDGELNNDINNWCVQTTLLDGATDPGTPGLPNDPCF
jgi:hypothetical protein